MGLIFSKIYDKPSTRDTLEKIEQEIQNIEERRWDKIKREQFVVQILSFIPITILIANVCILLYPSDSTWRDKLLLSIPIAILNLLLWVCRKVVQWYSHWSLDNEEARLRKLQKQKKKILEMVCETESYRVATELLEKYDPKQLRRREKAPERPSSPLDTTLTKFTASPIRSPQQQSQATHNRLTIHNQSMNMPFQIANMNQLTVPAPPPPTPVSKHTTVKPQSNIKNLQNTSISTVAASSVQGRPVRPILSKDRTFFEKLVDWVVTDGPENRFALICRFCYGHNGMSLAEEFETINFRCCYCYNLNTATNKHQQVHDQLQPERERSQSVSLDETKEVEKSSDPKSTAGILGKQKSEISQAREEVEVVNQKDELAENDIEKSTLIQKSKIPPGDERISDKPNSVVEE